MWNNHEQKANFRLSTQAPEQHSVVVHSAATVENHGPVISRLSGTYLSSRDSFLLLLICGFCTKQRALERLRTYVPPPTHYYSVPLTRQAAVLILLFADQRGDLRVILTIRANTLKACMASNSFQWSLEPI